MSVSKVALRVSFRSGSVKPRIANSLSGRGNEGPDRLSTTRGGTKLDEFLRVLP